MYQSKGTLTENVSVRRHQFPKGFAAGLSVEGYASVERETARIDNIINECTSQTDCPYGKDALLHAAGVIRDAMLRLLSRGKAVDVLEMGSLYIKPKKGLEDITTGQIKDFKVVFSPSELTQSQVVNITVGGEAVMDYSPQIVTVTDMDTMEKDTSISANKCVKVNGKLLSIAGAESDSCGVYFAPKAAAGNTYDTDETKWKRVDDRFVYTNKPSELLVRAPAVTSGEWYIVIRTVAPSNGIKYLADGTIDPACLMKMPRFGVSNNCYEVQ